MQEAQVQWGPKIPHTGQKKKKNHYDYSTECKICLLFLSETVVFVKTLLMFLLRNLFKFAQCNLSVHTYTHTQTHIS